MAINIDIIDLFRKISVSIDTKKCSIFPSLHHSCSRRMRVGAWSHLDCQYQQVHSVRGNIDGPISIFVLGEMLHYACMQHACTVDIENCDQGVSQTA